MYYFERHFTLDEARAELPWLRLKLLRLREDIQRLKDTHEHAQQSIAHATSNGGGAVSADHLKQRIMTAAVVEEINERGIQIKDPERGLVDFPHLRNGKEVLLCWLVDEDEIRYWHDLETGFSGRQPI